MLLEQHPEPVRWWKQALDYVIEAHNLFILCTALGGAAGAWIRSKLAEQKKRRREREIALMMECFKQLWEETVSPMLVGHHERLERKLDDILDNGHLLTRTLTVGCDTAEGAHEEILTVGQSTHTNTEKILGHLKADHKPSHGHKTIQFPEVAGA